MLFRSVSIFRNNLCVVYCSKMCRCCCLVGNIFIVFMFVVILSMLFAPIYSFYPYEDSIFEHVRYSVNQFIPKPLDDSATKRNKQNILYKTPETSFKMCSINLLRDMCSSTAKIFNIRASPN